MEFVFDDKIINCMDEDILLDTFQRMYNQKKYVQCVLYIEKKLSAFSSKFYDVMVVYLYSLIKSNNKEKALQIVKEELAMPYIPALFEERFREIYNELSYKEKESKEFLLSRDKIKEILETNEDKNVIILAIVEMCKLNIRDFIESIQIFFKRDLKNIYKVMLIDALRSQGVNYDFDLVNGDVKSIINPITSENVLESSEYFKIKEILEEKIGKHDPNLLSLANENLMLYLCDIYPYDIDETDYGVISDCIHEYSVKMYGNENHINLDINNPYIKTKKGKILSQLETACSI